MRLNNAIMLYLPTCAKFGKKYSRLESLGCCKNKLFDKLVNVMAELTSKGGKVGKNITG